MTAEPVEPATPDLPDLPVVHEEPIPPPAGLTERRYPSTIGGALYLLVLVAAGVGVALVVTDDWRLGVRVIAGALSGAALARLLLPQRDAGMLAVRHRFVDVLMLGGVAVALFFLVGSIPDQPGPP